MMILFPAIVLMMIMGAVLLVWHALWGFVALFALAVAIGLAGRLADRWCGPTREQREHEQWVNDNAAWRFARWHGRTRATTLEAFLAGRRAWGRPRP